ncbi:unnamed protein product, partial [Ixodes persulcatus]
MQRCLLYTGAATRWTRRVRALSNKYGVPLPTMNRLEDTSIGLKELREQVRAVETRRWERRAADKPALQTYISNKKEICKEQFFDNTLGSSLLFEARAGTLRTKHWQVKCGRVEASMICAICGEEEETMEHLMLRCRMLRPLQPSEVTLEEAFGFVGQPQEGDRGASDIGVAAGAAAGGNGANVIETTKRRLENWRR